MKSKKQNTKEISQSNKKDQKEVTLKTENLLLKEPQEIKTRTDQKELLTEASNILMQNDSMPESLAIQSMTQLNFVLQRLTKVSMEKIVNNEEILREELPFSLSSDAKKLSESIALLMKQVNESRKIRASTYIDLKKINQKDKNENK